MDIDDNVAVVGASRHVHLPLRIGAVYVHRKDDMGTPGGHDDTWIEVAELLPPDPGFSEFGQSVALSGPRLVAGAWVLGAAYVFRETSGVWGAQQKLLPSDGEGFPDRFGWSTAISGSVAAVGAPMDTDLCAVPFECGAVYVFEEQSGVWVETAKLAGSDTGATDDFGYSLDIDGDVLVVGAPGKSSNAGRVYVFERQGSAWGEVANLAASDTASGADFGRDVRISGRTLIAGAPGANGIGAAYVFTDAGNGWQQKAKLLPISSKPFQEFGWSVALSGDLIAVSSLDDDQGTVESGSVSLFAKTVSGWQGMALVSASDPSTNSLYGYDIALSSGNLLIGAFQDDGIGLNSGAAYVWSVGPPGCALGADAFVASLSAGATRVFTIDAGASHAGAIYLLLGTTAGTSPGTAVDGLMLPLNPDGPFGYFALSLVQPNKPPLSGSLGVLDGNGHATASFVVPPATAPGLAGVRLDHAYLVFQGPLQRAGLASNSVHTLLVP